MALPMQPEPARMPAEPAIYVSIQILRAVAALFVVVAHIALSFKGLSLYVIHLTWIVGVYGVYIFFVISGFLMVETSRQDFGDARSPATFLRKRIVRIVPLYWIFTSLVVAGHLVGHHALAPSYIFTSYFFLPYVQAHWARPVLSVGWTLNYEMFFYVLFAFVLLWRRRFALMLLAAIFCAILLIGHLHKSILDTGDPATAFEFLTDPVISLFAVGCFISVARSHWRTEIGVSVAHHMPIIASLVIFAGATLGVLALVRSDTIFPLSFTQRLILWLAAALLLAVCSRRELVPTDAVNRLLLLLGNASYSIYLSHASWET